MRQTIQNLYRVVVEPNQLGKHMARVEARFAENNFRLRVYFQAATPERVLSKLPSVLRFLQGHEEQLWLWGSKASDRSLFFEELLDDAGLTLDRRRDFPRAAMAVSAAPGAAFRPLQLAELKRRLSERLVPSVTARRAVEAARTSA